MMRGGSRRKIPYRKETKTPKKLIGEGPTSSKKQPKIPMPSVRRVQSRIDKKKHLRTLMDRKSRLKGTRRKTGRMTFSVGRASVVYSRRQASIVRQILAKEKRAVVPKDRRETNRRLEALADEFLQSVNAQELELKLRELEYRGWKMNKSWSWRKRKEVTFRESIEERVTFLQDVINSSYMPGFKLALEAKLLNRILSKMK